MDKTEVMDLFRRGMDCSQVVASRFADELDIDEEELSRMTAAFGGGAGIGEMCGAVAGAMIVLGLRYGNSGPDEPDAKAVMGAKRAEFLEKWRAARGPVACRELLGHDFSVPGELEAVIEEGLMMDLCPELVLDSIRILEEMI